MNYKKIIASALAAVLLTGMTGCSFTETNVTEVVYENTEPAEEETVTETEESTNPDTSQGAYTPMYTSTLAQFRTPATGDTVVTIQTNFGDIDILMLPEAAPKAVDNFVGLSEQDYYDGVTFHRVIYDFMIQGGDPEGTGRGGESLWGADFEDEFDINYFPYRGALAMANSGSNTNGSQFFIVQSFMNESKTSEGESWAKEMTNYGFSQEVIDAYQALGGTPFLYNRHTVFGQVVNQGMDVIDAIASSPTDDNDKPLEAVIIEDVLVTIIE